MEDVEETSTNIQDTMDPFDYQDMIETLAPTLPEYITTSLQPYPNVEFSQEGIQYGGMQCTWFYIEHIST
jgi:hypothetical protein